MAERSSFPVLFFNNKIKIKNRNKSKRMLLRSLKKYN